MAAPVEFEVSGIDALMGADAQSTLAQAFQRALVQMNALALREVSFIQVYCPEMLPELKEIINLRFHTNPGAVRKIVDAIKAIALSDYHKEANKASIQGSK